MSKLTKLGGIAQELEKAFKEAQAIKKGPALPLNIKRAAPKTKQELQQEAERVSRQMMGEHVTSGKKGDTKNLAGRSMKEAKRVKGLDYKVSPTKELPEVETYTPEIGEVKMAIPGDQTISDQILETLNDLEIGSTQEGGFMYGLGKLDRDDPLFWASNEGPAQQLQNKATALSQYYNTDKVLGEHLAMGNVANNFAMHMADANLKAFNSAQVHPAAIDKFNEIIRNGYQIKNPKTGEYKVFRFDEFPGIENPNEAYLAMMKDPELRKFFNARAKTPSVTEPLGLPNGLDVEYAVTEPILRDMEINLTGASVGRMKPGAKLTDDPDHDTYLKGIPGEFLGTREVLTPFKIAYPDATDYISATQRPQDFTGTIQKVFPHQKIDQQYLDEYNTYRDFIKKYTGKAKGGRIGKAGKIMEELNKAYEEAKAVKAVAPKVEAPTIIVPKRGKIKDVMENVRKSKGQYHARRVERAADEVPNLEHQYTQGALESAFTESNPQALMVMNPKLFEEYAHPLRPNVKEDWYYPSEIDNAEQMPYDEYIAYLERVARDHGFADVPYLSLSEAENGGLRISGHEGRHRNRALTNLGDESTLVRLLPRYNLTDNESRRYKEDYIDALNARLGLDPEVQPEIFPDVRLSLPKIFKDGGKVDMEAEFKKADTIGMAEGGSKRKSPHGKGSERTVTAPASFPDMSTLALTGKILARKGKEQLKKELANPSPQMAVDILGNLGADIVGMPSDLIEGVKGEPINTKGRNKPYNTSTMQQGKGKPMLGSENLYAQLKNAGITSGTERPLTETALALLSPAAIAKGPKLAKAIGKEAARQIETGTGLGKYMVEPRMNVVKPEGGQWSDMARERVERNFLDPQDNPAVDKWMQTTGRKYVLNRMGSPEDEVRKLLDKDISHIEPKKLREMGTDITRGDIDYLRAKRKKAGFPAEGLADTAAGKRWEMMTDEFINPNPASIYQDERFISEAPWAEKLDPDTPIYSGERSAKYLFKETGMPEIAAALNRAIKEKKLKPEQLNKVSMEDAVKLAHEQRLKDEAELAKDLPKVAEYPEAGMSWQELTHEDPDVLRKVLRREGDIMQNCIGNYCDDVLDSEVRLFSLRDSSGNPHVNIEVRTPRGRVEQSLIENGEDPSSLKSMSDSELLSYYEKEFPNSAAVLRAQDDLMTPRISQIKGKQNEKPVKDYIPFVQDFIKQQGPFRSIDDLSNASLIDLRRAQQHGVLDDSYPTVMQELGRLFPADRDQFGGINLTSDYGLRTDTDVMLREALKGMEGNYVSPEDIITHMRAQEARPVEQGYSKYWESLNPEAKAKGGQPKRIDLETQFRLADILTR